METVTFESEVIWIMNNSYVVIVQTYKAPVWTWSCISADRQSCAKSIGTDRSRSVRSTWTTWKSGTQATAVIPTVDPSLSAGRWTRGFIFNTLNWNSRQGVAWCIVLFRVSPCSLCRYLQWFSDLLKPIWLPDRDQSKFIQVPIIFAWNKQYGCSLTYDNVLFRETIYKWKWLIRNVTIL